MTCYTLTRTCQSRMLSAYGGDRRPAGRTGAGNRSIFSRRLKRAFRETVWKKGSRPCSLSTGRGYATFVSCRSCGEAVKCPHCDVTLTFHKEAGPDDVPLLRLYHPPAQEHALPAALPYIAPFGTGTQKIEEMARERCFQKPGSCAWIWIPLPERAAIRRSYLLLPEEEADILIGTQMIVKGHDFPKVTLVGASGRGSFPLMPVITAAGEETFDLLTQAAGRAGRGTAAGNVVIQTYQPDHYSVTDGCGPGLSKPFIRQEMSLPEAPWISASSRAFNHPDLQITDEGRLEQAAALLEECLKQRIGQNEDRSEGSERSDLSAL